MAGKCRTKYPNDKTKRKACNRLARRAVVKKAGGIFKKTFNDTKDVVTGKKKITLTKVQN